MDATATMNGSENLNIDIAGKKAWCPSERPAYLLTGTYFRVRITFYIFLTRLLSPKDGNVHVAGYMHDATALPGSFIS